MPAKVLFVEPLPGLFRSFASAAITDNTAPGRSWPRPSEALREKEDPAVEAVINGKTTLTSTLPTTLLSNQNARILATLVTARVGYLRMATYQPRYQPKPGHPSTQRVPDGTAPRSSRAPVYLTSHLRRELRGEAGVGVLEQGLGMHVED